jgi:UDP-N-acetylglucosamine 4,6-dehydratase
MNCLITGGTGSLGTALVRNGLDQAWLERLIIFSRDEAKQHEQRRAMSSDSRISWVIGDVRDLNRIVSSLRGVDIVIHAAAMKQVPICEENPSEAVMTNILGTRNIIEAAIRNSVRHVLFVSTDKAVHPTSVYGATKLIAERMIIRANSRDTGTRFSAVRFGNLIGSRGSVLPLFQEQRRHGRITLTDERMNRFWCTPEEAAEFIWRVVPIAQGGEVFVPRLPSFWIRDLAWVVAPEARIEIIGIRPGERLSEILIGPEESRYAFRSGEFFMLIPPLGGGQPPPGAVRVKEGFCYDSERNDWWLDPMDIAVRLGLSIAIARAA